MQKADGYRGLWYYNQLTKDEYVYKYSGGLGTYCAKHIPLAIYAPEVDKTFFCYGGTAKEENRLLHMVSYYDHKTGTVPRPTLLVDKQTDDAHDNPVISIDADGFIWVFSSAHGLMRTAYIFKSREPYSVDDFELIREQNYSYPQPWYFAGKGFLFLHTLYLKNPTQRRLFWSTSPDGREWSDAQMLAYIEWGHYQVSWRCGERVGTAFNFHPKEVGLNRRSNLYYVETADMGATWTNVQGDVVDTPMTEVQNAALIRDYQADGELAYMKDLNFDADGNPIILHVVGTTWEPAKGGPRRWMLAHWTGAEWAFREITTSDSCYDTGCLHVEADGTWRVIGPTESGPQPGNPGGEMAVWTSADQGVTWTMQRQVTSGSELNHTYARRPVNAHPDFYAFWADGHGRRPSESRLYFCNQDGTNVRRLPVEMSGDFAECEMVI
jgi:putative BNR repeat neuraminidase